MLAITVAGHLCLDLSPGLGATVELAPGSLTSVGALAVALGGSVANTGRALADLGAEVTPSATIGDDELGQIMLSKLAAEGFRTPQLRASVSASTSYSIVIERPGEDRTFWHHTGANVDFDGRNVEVGGIGLLHVGYPPLLPRLVSHNGRPLLDLLVRARAAGATTSLDLAVVDPGSPTGSLDWHRLLAATLAETDVVSPSLDDLTSALRITQPYSVKLVDELADWMLDCGAAVVAISAGRHGVRLRTASAERLRTAGAALVDQADNWAERSLTVPPLPVSPRTTNGAGDASTAGLLFGIARGADPEVAGALATASAAAVMLGERVTPDVVCRLDPRLRSVFTNGGPIA